MAYSFTGYIYSNTNTILATVEFTNEDLEYSDAEWGHLSETERQNLKYDYIGKKAEKYDYDYIALG